MKLKSLLAAAVLLTAPAMLTTPASAADYDGRRGDHKWSDSRSHRDHKFDNDRFDGDRHVKHRRFNRRLPWWAYDRPWLGRKYRHADRFDYNGPRRRDW